MKLDVPDMSHTQHNWSASKEVVNLPNGLELKCKLGISCVHKVIWKPLGGICLKWLATEKQRFSAELVYKTQKPEAATRGVL